MHQLSFGHGNAKLPTSTLTFSIPAGRTCPGARDCRSWVNSLGRIQDGPHTIFRCFAASDEVKYTNVHRSRVNNLNAIVEAIDTNTATDFITEQVTKARKRRTNKVRPHVSGDFFSADYLAAWVNTARLIPDLDFYCYTKSLNLFVPAGKLIDLPSNFYVTASHGGMHEHLEHLFPRVAYVVNSVEEAEAMGLEIDHDESHCFGNKSFCLLLHGTQPKGSVAAEALKVLKRQGHTGYNVKRRDAELVAA